MKLRTCFFTLLLTFGLVWPAFAKLNAEKLSDADIERVKTVIEKLTPLIQKREAAGTLPTLTFRELWKPLSKKEARFLKQFLKINARKIGVRIPYRGMATGETKLVQVEAERIKMNGKLITIPPQYLPPAVYAKYQKMMTAMEKEIGKRLYIESGYRSSAYQLFLFVYYLKNHDYSIRETAKWVALPGFSEHGAPLHQAIDFINADGVSGETDPAGFERLEEYQWLLKNAARFGFILSYPKDNKTITFEPWHWRCDTEKKRDR